MVIEKLTQSQKLDVNLTKSVDREVKIRFHVPSWPTCTHHDQYVDKYGKHKSHGNEETILITKT